MTKKGTLKLEMPAQGWSQFLTARKEMLDSYDKARKHSKKHKVETYHGNVAEAEFRKWLKNFLPEKFGVTSGYIISQGVSDIKKAPHYDVIIYEKLESPILWIENTPDASDQGRSMAIPAEYVKAVIEVKSSFEHSTVKDAIQHLSELGDLISGIDAPDERYKMYLPPDFVCGLLFYELRKKNEDDYNALSEITKGIELRGFFGGLILRGEDHIKEVSGSMKIMRSKEEIETTLKKGERTLLRIGMSIVNSIKITDNLYFGAMLDWTEPNFSQFAFDLVAMFNGTYEVGRLSSFHAFGTTEWAEAKKIEAKKLKTKT